MNQNVVRKIKRLAVAEALYGFEALLIAYKQRYSNTNPYHQEKAEWDQAWQYYNYLQDRWYKPN